MKPDETKPLLIIADDEHGEIKNRLKDIIPLFVHIGKKEVEKRAHSMVYEGIDGNIIDDTSMPMSIMWSRNPDPQFYIDRSKNRRVVLLLDIDWSTILGLRGQIESRRRGISVIAPQLDHDDDFRERSIILLKSLTVQATAARYRESTVRPLRLPDNTEGRIRLLAADWASPDVATPEEHLEITRYAQGIISSALLDIQKEAIFDGIRSGKWDSRDVSKAIGLLESHNYFNVAGGSERFGHEYKTIMQA